MLLALLLAAAPADDPLALSPEVRETVAQRDSLSPADFIAKIRMLGDRNDASAIELLGEIYAFGGFGVMPDQAKACDLFERAADRRGDAAHNLARCYETGQGGRAVDASKARQYYARGAGFGYAKSQCALGNLMVAGNGGPIDAAGGVELCRRGAEAGNADAQTDYGGYLLVGKVARRDPVEARRWLLEAAQQRQGNAAYLLAQIYWKGDGVVADRVVAARWWRVAHDAGRPDAALWLGREAFARSLGDNNGQKTVDRDILKEARSWFVIAAEKDPDGKLRAEATAAIGLIDETTPAKPPSQN